MNNLHASFAGQGLVRPRDGRLLGGVCAGLGRRFGLTAWQARLLFVLLCILVHASAILVYLVLWVLMPAEGSTVAPWPAGESQ